MNSAAARNTAVSNPSRTTITKPNTATPSAPPAAPRASPEAISSFILGAARHIHTVSVSTNTAPTSMPTPSTISSLYVMRVASTASTTETASARPAPASRAPT